MAELQTSEACECNKLARFSKDNNEYRAVQIETQMQTTHRSKSSKRCITFVRGCAFARHSPASGVNAISLTRTDRSLAAVEISTPSCSTMLHEK